jgi:GH15 family glucan-1,4-alpha-glucosidase
MIRAPEFAPLERADGYLPIEDYGLIGDGATSALIGRDGTVSWLCVPRFDSPPLFCGLLDHQRGGGFALSPDEVVEARQFYWQDAPILVTELRCRTGLVEIRDVLSLRAGADLNEDGPAAREELLRLVSVKHGHVRLRIEIAPYGGAEAEPSGKSVRIRCRLQPGLPLSLMSSRPVDGLAMRLRLREGEQLSLVLRWAAPNRAHQPRDPEWLLSATAQAWRTWMAQIQYDGPQKPLVRHSVMVLKLLDHFENGAMVAAPTTSLPEAIGGPRNWDYRYTWVRDAAFSVDAFHRVGMVHEAGGFLRWVLAAIERQGMPQALYNLDGREPPREREDETLEGYRKSRPVRWGNAAYGQRQHDAYGELLDCAYQWAQHYGPIDEVLWKQLHWLIESAQHEWRSPDHGIWEVRTRGRPFTYSAALCQVALDRGARLVEQFRLPGHGPAWRRTAEEIRQAILKESWSDSLNSLTQHLGGGGLDASLLALPLRGVVPADHPRMVATTKAVVKRLGAGKGLLYRYLPNESPDGLASQEGAFLLCSFWLVDNLARQGRLQEAMDLYDSLCARAGPLGLFPEQIDPNSGSFLGNYPQAFSHIGVISTGITLTRLLRGA